MSTDRQKDRETPDYNTITPPRSDGKKQVINCETF